MLSGNSSGVERQLPKLNVAGSIPVSRSRSQARVRDPGFLFVFFNDLRDVNY